MARGTTQDASYVTYSKDTQFFGLMSPTLSHAHSCPNLITSLTLAHIHFLSRSYSITLRLSQSFFHTLTFALSWSLLSLSLIHSLSHTLIHSFAHSLRISLFRSVTLPLSLRLRYALSLSFFLSISWGVMVNELVSQAMFK